MSYGTASSIRDRVVRCQSRLSGLLAPTPIVHLYDGLGLKAENLQPTGSFKVRGAFNSLLKLSARQRAAGVVAHSSGNHAQAVAFAAARLGVRATLVMPSDAPPTKRERVVALGGEVVTVGRASSERERMARKLSTERGLTLIEPYDAWPIIEATGTIGLEVLIASPRTEVVLAPVSGGGLIGGLAAAIKAMNPNVKVIGVEPELAADAYESVKAGRIVELPASVMALTIADGLRVQKLGDLNWPLVRDFVDEVITVSEAEIKQAMIGIAREAKLISEPSGAVAAAGARILKLRPERSIAILSGGNIDLADFIKVSGSDAGERSRSRLEVEPRRSPRRRRRLLGLRSHRARRSAQA